MLFIYFFAFLWALIFSPLLVCVFSAGKISFARLSNTSSVFELNILLVESHQKSFRC